MINNQLKQLSSFLFVIFILGINISFAQQETRLHRLFFDITTSPVAYFPKNEKALFTTPTGITINYLMANLFAIRIGYAYDVTTYTTLVKSGGIYNMTEKKYLTHYQRIPLTFNIYWKRNDTLDIYSSTGFIFGHGNKYSTFDKPTFQLGLGSRFRINKHFCYVVEIFAVNYLNQNDLNNNPGKYSIYSYNPSPLLAPSAPIEVGEVSYPSFSRWGFGLNAGISYNPW